MDLNFKCLGKNIGLMIVEILRPFEPGMTTRSDGTARGSLLFAHRGSKNKVISWKGKTVQLTSSFLTMISILFFFCHLKNSTFLHISISKSHHNLTLVVYFNWKVSFETADMKIIIQQKNRVWEPSEQTKPLPGVLLPAAAGHGWQLFGSECYGSRRQPTAGHHGSFGCGGFPGETFFGMLMDGCFSILMLDGYFFWRDVWRMSFDVMWKYSDEVFIFICLFRFSGRGPHGWG